MRYRTWNRRVVRYASAVQYLFDAILCALGFPATLPSVSLEGIDRGGCSRNKVPSWLNARQALLGTHCGYEHWVCVAADFKEIAGMPDRCRYARQASIRCFYTL